MEIKWFGVIAGLLTTVTAGLILWRSKIDLRRSISMHVADKMSTTVLFGIISIIGVVLMYLFATEWLIPTLQLPVGFAMVLFAGLACQLLGAWIPHTTGLSAQIHMILACIMAGLMLPILLFLPFSPVLPTTSVVVILIIIAVMTIAASLWFVGEHAKKYFLIYQLGYVICFFIALLVATVAAQPAGVPDAADQQIIPMSVDDFKDDPRIQGAIQNQLQAQNQQPIGPSSTEAGQLLQPAPKGMQGGD